MTNRRTVRHELLHDTRPAPKVPCLKDLDTAAFGFWGVVSGTWTLEGWAKIGDGGHGEALFHTAMRQRLKHVLHRLVLVGALDGRTPFVPFDADRRCLECGTIHEEAPVLRRSGATCFRNLWGTVPLNPAGLRPERRR